MYLTHATASYLTHAVLVFTIVGVLIYYTVFQLGQNRERHALLLLAFFVANAVLVLLRLVGTVLAPLAQLRGNFIEEIVIALMVLLLVQFAYHFPSLPPRWKWEARLALGVGVLFVLAEFAYAFYRFSALTQGAVILRSLWFEIVPLVGLVWASTVFARQTVCASRQTGVEGRPWPAHLWQPHNLQARTARVFSGVSLLMMAVVQVSLGRANFLPPSSMLHVTLSAATLVGMFLMAITYLSSRPETISFLVVITGTALVAMLIILSTVSWSVMGAFVQNHTTFLPNEQTLTFTPNSNGDYTVTSAPSQAMPPSAKPIDLTDQLADRGYPHAALDFTFPFYGRTYRQVYVANNGAVGLGEPLVPWAIENFFGEAPAIYPLYLGLFDLPARGGIVAYPDEETLIIIWTMIRPPDTITVQLTLHRDGRFQFSYSGLPTTMTFDPSRHPLENMWPIGAVPGLNRSSNYRLLPQMISTNALPVSGRGEGLVFAFYLALRQQLHQMAVPLAILIVISSLVILLGFPLLFYSNLVQPLTTLLGGVQRMEAGDYTVSVPVQRSDEIGYLTGVFNKLVARLGEMIHTLEARVTERTQNLHQANEHLSQTNSRLLAEITEREQAQAQLIEQQRIMATLEERERLGRDLHDGLGQVMGYLNVQAQAIHTQLGDGHLESAQRNLADLSNAVQAAQRDIRAHILGLRPAETPRQDFLTTVTHYIQQFSRSYDLPVTFNVPADFPANPFTPAVEEQVLRILQEGLTNIRRHAQAQMVTVSFRESDHALEMEISDDGIGFDPAVNNATPSDGHFGLEIMRERAAQVGGSLTVVTAPGQGTRLMVSLPVTLPAQNGDDLAGIKGLRLLLVDDHPLFLDGLRNLLLARGLTVIGLANSGPEAVRKTRDLLPDVVVMDLNMPGGDGLEATRAIKAEFPAVKVVILTMAEDDDALYQAIESGAAGYLLKNMEANQFCELLSGLMRGEAALDPRLTGRLLSEFARLSAAPSLPPASEVPLIEQQWEILGLVANGMTYKEVAAQLNLSYKTIQYHIAQILEKLGLENRAQAIAWYQQQESRQ